MIEDENGLPELPKGWIWTTCDNLIKSVETGKRPKGGVDNYKSGIPSIGGEHLSSDGGFNFDKIKFVPEEFFSKMNRGIIQKKDILVVKDGATTGKTSIVRNNFPFENACINEHVFILRTFERFVNPLYIFYYIYSGEGQQKILKKGIIGGINQNFAEKIKLPLPPLPEQHRIVAKIEELFTKLDAGVSSLEKTKTQLKRYRQAVLKSAMEGRLTEKWREAHKGEMEPASVLLERLREDRKRNASGKKGKYKELSPLDVSDLPELPEGWVWTRIGEIIEKLSLTGKKLKQSEYQGSGRFPVIDQGQDFIGGYTDREELKVNCKQPVIVFGDHTKVVKYVDFDFIAGADGIKVIRSLGVFYPKLFYYFLYAIPLPDKGYARHFQFLEKSLIPLPPLPEQQKIVEEIERRLSVADETEKTVEQSLKQSEALRQSILKKAFEGKLVPQDPTDEPASVLLERIKEEKAKHEAEKKTKKRITLNDFRGKQPWS